MHAKRYLVWRRKRDALIGPGLFEDPAWDILLDLFTSRVEGTEISVSSACIASGAAATTALRWIAKLETLGLVVRRRDANDGRRSLVSITDEAADKIRRWVNATFVE